MTRNAEVIRHLLLLKECAVKSHNDTGIIDVKIDSFNFVIDMAIQALSQEPCDDVVSREAVLNYIHRILNQGTGKKKSFEFIQKYVANMPSVKPQEPTGYWIEEDMFDGDMAYRCSECNELFWIESGTPKDNEYNFCPKCGKRLVEPQEISDRNLKMWKDIYTEEKRRERSDKE